jgi:hypothetical protein
MGEYKFVNLEIISFMSPCCCTLQEWPPPGFFSRERIRHLIWWDKFVYVQDVRGLRLLQLYLWTFKSFRMLCSSRTAWSWRRGHYDPSKLQKLTPSWNVVTSQKTSFALNFFMITFRRVRKITKKTNSFVMPVHPSVRPSVRMEQLGPHWRDFHEIWYLLTFRKTAKKIQVSLKSDKNSGYFKRRPIYIFDHVSLSYSYNDDSHKRCRGNQNHPIIFSTFPPPPQKKNRAVYEILWKNILQLGWPQKKYGACALHAG